MFSTESSEDVGESLSLQSCRVSEHGFLVVVVSSGLSLSRAHSYPKPAPGRSHRDFDHKLQERDVYYTDSFSPMHNWTTL